MVELIPTELTKRKALDRQQAENEIQIAQNEAKIEANEAEIAKNCEEIKRLKEKSLKLTRELTMYLSLSAIFPVLFSLSAVTSSIFLFPDFFADISTEYGYEVYAENAVWTTLQPQWLKMPANVIVNVGYLIVGAYWLKRLFSSVKPFFTWQKVTCLYLKVCFCWCSIYYGFIQAGRIVFQNHSLAVLDQWVTLPFFALACLMCYIVKNGPLSNVAEIICIFFSLLSYGLALILKSGFEIALFIHVLIALVLATDICISVRSRSCWKLYVLDLLCCIGFVVLKLADLYLPETSVLFQYFSGHFWSKICDVMQIHYTLRFVEEAEKVFDLKRKTESVEVGSKHANANSFDSDHSETPDN